MAWRVRDRRQRADVSSEGTSVHRLPQGDLGTPGRYWIDRHVPARVATLAAGRAIRVLDLGCHDGAYLHALRGAGVRGEYLGIDIAPSPRWDDVPRDEALHAEWRVWDAHRLRDLEPRGFDVILSIATFEHFERDDEVLDGVPVQLNAGGSFVLVVPSPVSKVVYGDHGFRRYDEAATRRRLEARGLKVTSVTPICGLPSLFWWALWFRSSEALVLAGKATLGAAAGFSRSRAKRFFGRADRALNRAQFWHQRSRLGRAAHRALVRGSAQLDAWVPGMPVLYEFIARKPG